MYAIINADGHQRRVTPGEIVWFEENRELADGDTFQVDTVLLLNDGTAIQVGTPTVEGACVEAQVLRHVRDRKVDIMKYKRRKGYVRKKGHRHDYVEARILSITDADGQIHAATLKQDEAPTTDVAPESVEAVETTETVETQE